MFILGFIVLGIYYIPINYNIQLLLAMFAGLNMLKFTNEVARKADNSKPKCADQATLLK